MAIMTSFRSLLTSFVLFGSLTVAQQSNGPSPTTVSLWLPWMHQNVSNLQASVINAVRPQFLISL